MSNVLFEAAFCFDFMRFIPVYMTIFFLFFPKIYKNSQKGKYTMKTYKILKIFCVCVAGFMFLLSILTVFSTALEYETIVGAYKDGEYQVVEGYVEKFDLMPYEGHKDESFEINSVKFSYSDYNITFGYNNTKSHGGVIKGNGQHLKIGYIDVNGENIIVYIEQLE